MLSKKSLIVGAAVTAATFAGLGAAGVVSAATTSSSTGSGTSIVDTIATTFNLNKDEVQAVFDEDRSARQAERKAEQAERLATAVKDDKLTQDQADHITSAQSEIEKLMSSAEPGSENDTAREQVKTKMDALRAWAEENNIDMQYIGMMHGGHGGPKFDRPATTDTSDSN